MSSELMKRMLTAVPKNENVSVLNDSAFLNCIDEIPTPVPAINIALSGRIKGGLQSGITVLAAPSRHFKSNLGLLCVAAYLKKYPEAVCVFYDSEFGSTEGYFRSFGIDPARVLHVPIDNIETLKFDVVQRLDSINRGDKVIFFLDSIGNLASKKEIEDALGDKSSIDMTRAKVLKSVFRMITPRLSMKDLPMVVVNHVYQEIGQTYPKTIMGGGTGPLLAAQTVIFVSRAQEKEDDELSGYRFTLIVEKSRRVKEKSKIALEVSFKAGINRWSGIFDLGLELGVVKQVTKGWYSRPTVEGDKKWRRAETECAAFWKPVFEGTNFEDAIEQHFLLPTGSDTNIFEDEALEIDE